MITMHQELKENDKRRLTALIAAPLKADNVSPEVAESTATQAVIEFAKAYKVVFGINIDIAQREEIKNDVLRKLG
ncbi:hypothetical protein EC99P2_00019 [Enterococcus phage EC99P2]|nr:hypothetical protein EC99P2_00019 [Enterococcus phage EC99P2]